MVGLSLAAARVGIDLDVIADAVGGEESEYATGGEQALAHDLIEQLPRIFEQAGSGWTDGLDR